MSFTHGSSSPGGWGKTRGAGGQGGEVGAGRGLMRQAAGVVHAALPQLAAEHACPSALHVAQVGLHKNRGSYEHMQDQAVPCCGRQTGNQRGGGRGGGKQVGD